MTAPFDYTKQLRSMTGEVNAAVAGSEWSSFLAKRQELFNIMLKESSGAAQQLGLAPPDAMQQAQTDPGSMKPVDQTTDAQRQDLVSRAAFWNIPNPEQLDSQTLSQAIAAKRAGLKRAPEPTIGTFATALGASAVAAASSATALVGHALDNFPFGSDVLRKILHTEQAKNWLYDVSSKADEDVQAIKAQQPAEDIAAYQFVTGVGKMAGYALPAFAAWEGLGLMGAALPEMTWLGRAGTPMARAAIKGALTSALLEDPNATTTEKAYNLGLGTILGGLSMYGTLGVSAVLGAIGAGVGGNIGATPQEQRDNAIKYGLGAAALPLLAPSLAKAFLKTKSSFKSPLDDAIAAAIPVDQTQAPAAPGEVVAHDLNALKQVSANPVPQRFLQAGQQGIEPTNAQDLASLIREEPTRVLGPGGTPQEVPTGPSALPGQSQVAGLLPVRSIDPTAYTEASGIADDMQHFRRAIEDPAYAADHGYVQGPDGPFSPATQLTAAEMLNRSSRAYDLAIYNQQRGDLISNRGFGAVTSGPDVLIGSKVAATDGTPLRVYHGTAADFGDFDMSKLSPTSLFGPGLYHTENIGIAEGYAGESTPPEWWVGKENVRFQINSRRTIPSTPETDQAVEAALDRVDPVTIQQLTGADVRGFMLQQSPNVRPAWLNIKNPFDIDKQYTYAEANTLIDRLAVGHPEYKWDDVRSYLSEQETGSDFTQFDYVKPPDNGTINGEILYQHLADAQLIAKPQGPEQVPVGNWLTIPIGQERLGEDGLNAAFDRIGIDGITHIGGARTGSPPHRVWIALRPEQVHPPWNVKPLSVEDAAGTADALTKQSTIMESADLNTAAGKPELTDSDVVAASKATNPAGVSIVRDIGKPLDVLSDHPDVHFVERAGKLDALVGPVTDNQVAQYEKYGMFEGQRITTAKGYEGTIISDPGGDRLVLKRDSGPPMTVKKQNVFPSRFGEPQVDAPDLYDSFKADLLRHMNDEADLAGMAPVESIWDPRVADLMQPHLMDYLDRRGINDPATRQTIDAMVNQRWIEEARDLDPEMRDLQAKVGDQAIAAGNEREYSNEPIPVSTEEKAASKGFIWLTDPGTGGGKFRDMLNPEATFDIPVESQAAADEFLHGVDRTPEDQTPASDVPPEVAEHAPADGVLEPTLGLGEHSDMLADHLNEFGSGGGAPPEDPPGGPGLGPDEWARIPGNKDTLGAQFARMRRDDPLKLDALRESFKSNVFRYTRYLMAKMETKLTDAGIDMGRAWRDYEALESGRTQADYHAKPWIEEYASIMREFQGKILRDGTVTRIHEIEDPNARYSAWYHLGESHGYSDAQIKKFITADDRLSDFNHRWFNYLVDDPSYGLTAEREIFRYMSHVRAKQAVGAPGDPYDGAGFLSPKTDYFAEFAREGNMQFRVMDARDLGNYMIRAGMFKKYQAGPWQDLVSAWQDPRVPSEFSDKMLGHAQLMKFGYDPRGDLLVNGVQKLVSTIVPISRREAATLLNVPMSGMYRSMLGGRTSIFFRDAIQPMLALAKVNIDTMAGVYRDVLKFGDTYTEMRQRGLEGGWITPEAPQMEAQGVFEDQGLRGNELGGLTPEQAARRELFAKIGDVGRNAPEFLKKVERGTNTLNWYGREQQVNRMIVGEAAYRQATTALSEFRRTEMEAAFQRDPSVAMTYNELADQARFSSFEEPIQRRIQEYVDAGQDEEAAKLFARQVADWSQFKYGRREQPQIVRNTFGRFLYTFGNFTGQFAEAMNSALRNGTPGQRVRAGMTVGMVSLGLYKLEQETGWGFSKWAWPNAFKFVGSPVAQGLANAYEAVGGLVAQADNRNATLTQQQALTDMAQSHPLLSTGAAVFPYTGYMKTAAQLVAASQGTNPAEQAARYMVTGDKGDVNLQYPPSFWEERARQIDSTAAAGVNQPAIKSVAKPPEYRFPAGQGGFSFPGGFVPPASKHPGSGALP